MPCSGLSPRRSGGLVSQGWAGHSVDALLGPSRPSRPGTATPGRVMTEVSF